MKEALHKMGLLFLLSIWLTVEVPVEKKLFLLSNLGYLIIFLA
jgi:hypothetical protein